MSYRTTYDRCTIYGCGGELFWRTLCERHREELPAECVLDDCVKPAKSRGLCGMHGFRFMKYGDPQRVKRIDTGGVLVHGTVAGYKHHGCRCDSCREARRAYEKAWRATNPESARRMSQKRREKDPERFNSYRRKWKQQNPDKVYTSNPLRAANPFDDEAVAYSTMILLDPCAFCGAPSEHVDHIDPLAAGGTSDWDNLAALCASCNTSKGSKSLLDYLLYRRNT